VVQESDGWTIATADGLPSAHFEHDVVVREEEVEVQSTFKWIEEALGAVQAD
jgi:methionyl aminopeptidase